MLLLMLRLLLLVLLLMIGLRVRLTVGMRRIAARMVLASAVAIVTREPMGRAAMSSEQMVQMLRGGVLRVRRLPRMLRVPEQAVAIEAGAQIGPPALVRGRAGSGVLDLVGVGCATGVADGRHVGTAALMRRIAKRRIVEPPQPAVSKSVPVTANSLMLWEIV